jgi:hypothetical protein
LPLLPSALPRGRYKTRAASLTANVDVHVAPPDTKSMNELPTNTVSATAPPIGHPPNAAIMSNRFIMDLPEIGSRVVVAQSLRLL